MNARSLLVGAAMGSAAMFILDPNGGRRRRALMRDKMTLATHRTREALDATSRDLANRATGIAAVARGRWSDEPVSGARLVERVRARLGRVCSHPHAIDVEVHGGNIVLRGPVLSSEANDIVAAAAAVRGVSNVTNELQSHESAEGIPSLQGAGRVGGPSLDILQDNWAPATRAVVSAGLLATGVWMALTAKRSWQPPDYRHAVM